MYGKLMTLYMTFHRLAKLWEEGAMHAERFPTEEEEEKLYAQDWVKGGRKVAVQHNSTSGSSDFPASFSTD